ncbi:ABC transporter ATP-binding protein [Oricola cellulosilytica]|uniref:ATP-binding cassette domain-containing protein n=1 Tax=Oricola cellulosilytica TaxID=1429082 RepID=A0A4R0P8X7_9HYPH|nr:ABC transporter ATP-binding protein [Oricola cellulosilytica]TCD13523.1 ATP-binding cassette domain-containing protein [Oricola cellulosilytica]
MSLGTGLMVEDLSHSYGARKALSNVSFSVERGCFCALLGPNGAGKSTLFSLLTGLFTSKSGDIHVAGFDLAKKPRSALAALGVVFQQPTLDMHLSVHQNMRYYAALQGLSGKHATRRIGEALEQLEMADRAGEKVRALNGGHRRRMEIARAMLHEPAILLLDEPTVGLDTSTRQAITAHVHKLARSEGLTVLWATHLVDEVEDEDQLVILHKGTIRADGTAATLRGARNLGEAFLALTAAGNETE